MNDDSGGAKSKKKLARRKRRFKGLALIVRKGQAYLVAQGIEQPEAFDGRPDAQFVEVGTNRTVAFKVTPSEVAHIACDLLMQAAFHVKNCEHCNEMVVQTAVDIGVLEKADEAP